VFAGFIYSLWVYNTVTSVSSEISTSCTGGCSACPSDNTCISACALGTYLPDCISCSSSGCTANCAHSEVCTLCNNDLCDVCSTLEDNTCSDCVTGASLSSNDCSCDAGSVKMSEGVCGCPTECSACFGSTKYECSACANGYYLQQGSTFCFDFCADPHGSSGQTCTGND